jgi:hypothetical protein
MFWGKLRYANPEVTFSIIFSLFCGALKQLLKKGKVMTQV